ncbi:S4 domain-containing protein [Porphyromonas macacae]|uniref:23S rRNA pseudouridine synthase F n=1 Tax=Porphyromonas macacae TaxID=28115 RepID=A0A379DGR5_9PORP|nr:S4 domain-containing protein [Porphyromonas macacae]SUB77144.1 23S rRNA pseudouridine synthase F [Porphyromonas macacae]
MKVRINKLLSDAGIGSRRDVEQLIRDGRVIINGREAGLTDVVGADDEVLLDDMDLPVADLIREAEFEQTLRESEDTDRPSAGKQNKKKHGNAPGGSFGNTDKSAKRFEKDEWDRQFADHSQPNRKQGNKQRPTRNQDNMQRASKGRSRNIMNHRDED